MVGTVSQLDHATEYNVNVKAVSIDYLNIICAGDFDAELQAAPFQGITTRPNQGDPLG